MAEEISNLELMNQIKSTFVKKTDTSKDLRDNTKTNLISYMKSIVSRQFDFGEINLEHLEGINIKENELVLMVEFLLEQIIGKSTDDRIKNLFYFMGLTANDLEDLDDFFLAGFDLYHDLQTEFNPLTSGSLIQYFCALLEEFLKKLYSIKTGVALDKYLTLAPLISKLLKFAPYQNQRTKKGIEVWQVPIIWSYELRNLLMHNVMPIPNETFQSLFFILNTALLLVSHKITTLYQDWFISCPHCGNPVFIKHELPDHPVKCIFCNAEISPKK